jgi:hypothetical protein
MFKSVELSLNNQKVSENDVLYAYKSYIEMLLSYSQDVKSDQMWASLFFQDNFDPDEIGKDKISKAGTKDANRGAKMRWAFTKYSRQFEMFGQIHTELFSQPKLIPGKYELRIKFHRNSPEFALMALDNTKRYSIAIDDAAVYFCVKKIAPEVREAHELTLNTKNFKYPVRKILMKFLTRSLGQMDINEPNLYKGTLPRRIVIGLVDSEAMNGSLHKNPFNFKHFDVRSIELRKNGHQLPFEQIDVITLTKDIYKAT